MPRPTKAALRIAEHLGMDSGDFEAEYRYQPTRYTKPVYAIGDDYWSAGSAAPKHVNGQCDLAWQRVLSSYDRETTLWHATSED